MKSENTRENINYKKLYEQKCKELELLKKQFLLLEIKINDTIVENKVLKSNKNIGEKDEVLLLHKLYKLNETKEYDSLIKIFGNEACKGIVLINLKTNLKYNNIQEIIKANSCFKADVCIKMNKTGMIYFPSIKSASGANPSILNHTARNAKIFNINGYLNKDLNNLDEIINEYNKKRKKGIFKEDINISSLESLKKDEIKESFIKCLSYFIFDGTGKGFSSKKANSLLFYNKGSIYFENCTTDYEKNKYVISLLPVCILSLRNKGMPKVITDVCKPWIYEDITSSGVIKYKGSLHIRCKRSVFN